MPMVTEVFMAREGSVADVVERMIERTTRSLDAALYRFDNSRLARALEKAVQRGVRIRLVVDRNKYEETAATRELLAKGCLPFRLLYGRQGRGSKMHHKFSILDNHTVVAGSYNWTLESEEQNYDHLLVLRDPELLGAYRREFEALWEAGERM